MQINSGKLISLAALLLVALLLSFSARAEPPVAQEGLIDLSAWDFRRDGNVELRGEYEFYWGRFLNRHELLTEQPIYFAEVPKPWSGVDTEQGPVDANGYATYRLNILLPPEPPQMAIKFREIGTSARIFVDGEMMLKIGHPGVRARSTEAAYKPSVITFSPKGNRVELVFHVASYDHRTGGLWHPILLGSTENILRYADQQIAIELLMFGALIMIAIYNLAFFALRPEGYANLFLSLFCLSASIRILSVNERFLLRVFPDIDWAALTKIEYNSWYLLIPFFAHFMLSLFPRYVDKRAVYVADGISGLAIAIVIVTPMSIFSWTAPVMQLVNLATLLYGVYCLLLARRQREEGANLLLLGFLFLVACTVNDLLVAAWIINTPTLVGLGIVTFAVCQSILASFDFAHSVKTVEKQHEQLATTSLKLQTQEKLRLEAELESRKVSAKFKESQQFEALGLLAHGVVSDLKESFAEAAKETQVLAEAVKSDPSLLTALEKAQETANRSVAVIEDLLSLSTFDTNAQSFDVNTIIEELLNSEKVKTLAEQKNIELDYHLMEAIQQVGGSQLHVRRILENLLTNAFNSQPAGGSVNVSTEQIYTDGRTLFYDTIGPGYYVILSVEDKGSGIHPEDLDSIFQPFFSRGDSHSESMGLGMSVVRAIIRQLDGGIDVISEMGQGTRFDIYLQVALPN